MMRFATDYDRGPLAVRYPRGAGPGHLPESRSPIVLGKSETLRSGRHVSLIALGSMVEVAWDVALELEKSGVVAEVINARFAKPLDLAAFAESAQRTGAVVTLEENVRIGGFGQQVRDGLADAGLGGLPFAICALPDAFVEHGTQPLIRKDCGLDAASITQRVQQLLGRKGRR
jgi:1-deoxy-D-xylulose-5-phosphate synthase